MPRTESNLFADNSQNRKFYYRNGLPGRISFPDRHSGPKYLGLGPAWMVRTGTTKRNPSAEATSPPPHRRARPMPFWAATRRAAARARGIRFGRPLKLTSDQVSLARRLIDEGRSTKETAKV